MTCTNYVQWFTNETGKGILKKTDTSKLSVAKLFSGEFLLNSAIYHPVMLSWENCSTQEAFNPT